MKVLSASSELFPLVKTGGLADVTGALPAALKPHGVEMLSIVPGYPAVLAALRDRQDIFQYADLFGGKARLLRGTAMGIDIVAIEAPHLYNRTGNIYLGPDGKPVSTTRPPGEVISMKNLVAPLSTPLPPGLDNPQKNLMELIVDRMKTAVGLNKPPSAALQTNYTPGISRRNRERREESRRRD